MTAHDLSTWRHKLYALHHELLYPAFLGAALFEFARRLIEDGSAINIVWFFSGLWFVVYFSVAFVALAETPPRSFGRIAFIVSFAEIAIILYAIVSISLVAASPDTSGHAHSSTPQLNYFGIYLSWILIPITAVILNFCARRTIRTALGVAAIVLAAYGLAAGQSIKSYCWLLFLMYLLLFFYLLTVFGSLNALWWDITFEKPAKSSAARGAD
jgi:hypothetical protein